MFFKNPNAILIFHYIYFFTQPILIINFCYANKNLKY